MFGQTSFSKIKSGPELPEHLSASKKRKREDNQNADITLFKQVRVLSKKTRIRRIKQISGSFSRLAGARNGFTEISTSTACENILLKSGATMPNQPSGMPYRTKIFGPATADSRSATFLNTIAVPRMDYIPGGDDSDDDGTIVLAMVATKREMTVLMTWPKCSKGKNLQQHRDDSDCLEDSSIESYSDKKRDDSAANLSEAFQGNGPHQPRDDNIYLEAQYGSTVEDRRARATGHTGTVPILDLPLHF